MNRSQTESCGRCAITSVVDTANDEDSEGNEHSVFDEKRIEIDETELRIAATPAVLAGWMKHRLDELVARFVYGR